MHYIFALAPSTFSHRENTLFAEVMSLSNLRMSQILTRYNSHSTDWNSCDISHFGSTKIWNNEI